MKREEQNRFYNDFKKQGFSICYNLLLNYHDSEECLQEGFIKFFEAVEKPEFKNEYENSMIKFLRVILTNQCFDYIRKNKKIKKVTNELSFSLSNNLLVQDGIVQTENKILIMINALNKIKNPEIRDTMKLYAFGYKYSEIARIQKIGIGNVKSRIVIGRRKMNILFPDKLKSLLEV